MTLTITHVKSLIWTALAVMPLSIGSNAATAKITDNPPTVKVGYSDLNLDSAKDTQVLYNRIRSAAYQVCGQNNSLDLAFRNLYGKCVVTAISVAVDEVHSDALTALYNSKVSAHWNSGAIRTASVR